MTLDNIIMNNILEKEKTEVVGSRGSDRIAIFVFGRQRQARMWNVDMCDAGWWILNQMKCRGRLETKFF